MYYAISALTGALVALMIAVNGGLTAVYGTMPAAVIIHVVGLGFITLWMFYKKEKFAHGKKISLLLYTGGAIGVATTACTNAAFGHVSVSAIMALSLFGQGVTSIIIDHFGLMGMPVLRFDRKKLIGLSCILIGIVLMTIPFGGAS